MAPRVHRCASAEALVRQRAGAIQDLAQRCITRRERFDIVLAGGATPRALYQALRHIDADWGCWHAYFGDERLLPPGHPQRKDYPLGGIPVEYKGATIPAPDTRRSYN